MTEQSTTLQTSDTETTETRDWDERIGKRMQLAVRYVAKNGAYPSKHQLALRVGPHGSTDYGYQIIDRCLGRDLLELDPDHDDATKNGHGAVVLTDKGCAYYNHITDGGDA